jgi:ribosomal-protein-alanine N-acetyltransferase
MTLEDAEQAYRNWLSDPLVTLYMSWEAHKTVEDTKAILYEWQTKSKEPSYYHWGIELKEDKQIIGAIGAFTISEKHREATLGYCLGRAYWAKGYMTEATKTVVEHLVNRVGINRVQAKYNPNNIGSGRVLKKCGFQIEGVNRQGHFSTKLGFMDAVCCAILKSDIDAGILESGIVDIQ